MTTVSFPSRCAVAVVCGEHLVSQVYPSSVPVEVFVDGVVELLNDDLRRRGTPGIDVSISYELQRANGSPLDVTKTLDELGIEDGATLVLAPSHDGDPFEPQYEALSTGLARAGKRLFEPVTAKTASNTALAILGMVSVVIAALCLYGRVNSQSGLCAAIAGAAGLALGVVAAGVRRWRPERQDLLTGLCWAALPSATVGAAAAAPGEPGAAHLFIGAVVVVLLIAVILGMTQQHIAFGAAVITVSAVTGIAAGVQMFVHAPIQRVGMGALIGVLFVLTVAPTIALWSARIRPPHFGSITGRDLFRRFEGMAADSVAPVDEGEDNEPDADATPAGVTIAAAARRANAVLTGICVGAAVSLPAAVWATLMPGRPRSWAAALLAVIVVAVVICRARGFTDRKQAVALVCGAAAATCAGVVRYVVETGGRSPAVILLGSLILAGFATAAMAAALIVPTARFTPMVRMAAEWLELLGIVAALPLAAWIGGLFTWVRMR